MRWRGTATTCIRRRAWARGVWSVGWVQAVETTAISAEGMESTVVETSVREGGLGCDHVDCFLSLMILDRLVNHPWRVYDVFLACVASLAGAGALGRRSR
jgi:hypothetical protein